jgi:group I intron endonuclease
MKHFNNHLQNAWNKYGENSFDFLLLEEVLDINLLSAREGYWISKLDTLNKERGYNIEPIDEMGNHSVSQETKDKLSKIGKNQFFSQESRKIHAELTIKAQGSQVGEKNKFYGKKHSPETIEIIKQKRAKQIINHSEETKRKISESNKITKRKNNVNA